MLLGIILCLLLSGCNNQETSSVWKRELNRTYLRLSGIEWIVKDEILHTELNRFGTKLWMERAKDNMILASSGPKLQIDVQTSSFLEVKDKLEFRVKLLCKPSDSDIALKIKVKGQKPITNTGSTIDKVASQIAAEVIRRVSADYGRSKFRSFENVPERTVTRSEDPEDLIQYNGESAPTTKKLVKPPSSLSIENLIPEVEQKGKTSTTSTQPAAPVVPVSDLLQSVKGDATKAADKVQADAASLLPTSPVSLVNAAAQIADGTSAAVQELGEIEKSPADAGDRYARLAASSLGL